MFILAFDGKHKVLKTSIVGVLSSDLLARGIRPLSIHVAAWPITA